MLGGIAGGTCSFAGAKAGLVWSDTAVAVGIAAVIAVQATRILVGASRKGFIGKISGPEGRLEGSLAAASAAIINGANIVRVHDVKETVRAVRMIDAIRGKH